MYSICGICVGHVTRGIWSNMVSQTILDHLRLILTLTLSPLYRRSKTCEKQNV